jgi:hypothetical protein
MTWDIHPKEFETVIRLNPTQRYEYFIKRVAWWEKLFGLSDGVGTTGNIRWASSSDNEGRLFVPVWPHPEYAAACATEEWSGKHPTSISIDVWLEDWIPDMIEVGHLVSVFKVPLAGSMSAVTIPQKVGVDLLYEMEKMEDVEWERYTWLDD